MLFVQDLDLREAFLMIFQMVGIIEVLRYILLLIYQIVIFMVTLGKIHWEGYLFQIVNLIEAHSVGCQMVELI